MTIRLSPACQRNKIFFSPSAVLKKRTVQRFKITPNA
jgi:hypothetical protein